MKPSRRRPLPGVSTLMHRKCTLLEAVRTLLAPKSRHAALCRRRAAAPLPRAAARADCRQLPKPVGAGGDGRTELRGRALAAPPPIVRTLSRPVAPRLRRTALFHDASLIGTLARGATASRSAATRAARRSRAARLRHLDLRRLRRRGDFAGTHFYFHWVLFPSMPQSSASVGLLAVGLVLVVGRRVGRSGLLALALGP